MRKYNVQAKKNEQVQDIKKEKDVILIKTDKDTYQTKTVIITSGAKSKELNIPGEAEFRNKA